MVQITLVAHDGIPTTVDARPGRSVMDAAVRDGVLGIHGARGGACATCHVYVDAAWRDAVGLPSASEASMPGHAVGPRANSRLGCQVVVTEALAGLIVHMPETQQ